MFRGLIQILVNVDTVQIYTERDKELQTTRLKKEEENVNTSRPKRPTLVVRGQ